MKRERSGFNWSVFADKTGPILGPLMAYEVLSTFFLEAGFLGIMLFGRNRVGPGLHMFATAMVAFGTLISATWILSVNSWMQTPVGYEINEVGQFVPHDWWQIVFNPSFPYRLVHMVLAAYLTTAFVVAGVTGWHLLRDNEHVATRLLHFYPVGRLQLPSDNSDMLLLEADNGDVRTTTVSLSSPGLSTAFTQPWLVWVITCRLVSYDRQTFD